MNGLKLSLVVLTFLSMPSLAQNLSYTLDAKGITNPGLIEKFAKRTDYIAFAAINGKIFVVPTDFPGFWNSYSDQLKLWNKGAKVRVERSTSNRHDFSFKITNVDTKDVIYADLLEPLEEISVF